MQFLTKDNLYTYFATELALRYEADIGLKITIIPGPNRSDRERQQLSAVTFDSDITNLDLRSVAEKAKDAIGISDTKRFSSDILRVELSGPSWLHLTIVDLPSLFRAANSD
jgi:hypothetical protein